MRMVLDIADVLGPESLETSDRYVGRWKPWATPSPSPNDPYVESVP